jgi:hypothetical protein
MQKNARCKKCKVIVPPDAQQFAMILAQTGLSDAFLAKLFGVNQSTVSRLRNAKIKKTNRYFIALEAGRVLTGAHDEQLAARMIELTTIAGRSPTLRMLLLNLHKLMQEMTRD